MSARYSKTSSRGLAIVAVTVIGSTARILRFGRAPRPLATPLAAPGGPRLGRPPRPRAGR